jgi:hypothetical protein
MALKVLVAADRARARGEGVKGSQSEIEAQGFSFGGRLAAEGGYVWGGTRSECGYA